MRLFVRAASCALMVMVSVTGASAQGWNGFYVAGTAGRGIQRANDSETVRFDTNLDGAFTDTIRTGAGADAFGPGFCGGAAVGAAAVAGCSDDENGMDFGGRVGYDRQMGRFVIGALVDVSKSDVIDSVTAFSVTPAFYTMTREINYVAGLRGRAGVDVGRVLIYGTGGAAWGNVEQSFTTSNTVNTFVATEADANLSDDVSVWGYQAGGGVEFNIGARMRLIGEYIYTSLDNREESGIGVRGPAPATNPFILVNAGGTNFERTGKFEFHAARIGFGVRF
ncbi:MAG: outer membrane beta-barrel protein [Acidobacteriota bacterium]|nr:outer membrane beta-barrel protein [Acidobacteriota bacterium]